MFSLVDEIVLVYPKPAVEIHFSNPENEPILFPTVTISVIQTLVHFLTVIGGGFPTVPLSTLSNDPNLLKWPKSQILKEHISTFFGPRMFLCIILALN